MVVFVSGKHCVLTCSPDGLQVDARKRFHKEESSLEGCHGNQEKPRKAFQSQGTECIKE